MKKINDKSKKNKNSIGADVFQGNVRLQLESADDYTHVNQFCEYLKTYRNLRITSYSWSEAKGLIITIYLQEAAPLGDILRQIPMVAQIYKRKKNIVVVMNPVLTETATPALTLSPEEAMAS